MSFRLRWRSCHEQFNAPSDDVKNPQQNPVAPTTRLFLALLPSENLKVALAIHRDQWQWPDFAAVYAPADWHVTLHFIGSVPRERLDELRAGLTVPMTSFDLRLDVPERWPHGLAVLRAATVPEALQQLHADLGQTLLRLGLPTEPRLFRPHLTLARHAAQARPPPLSSLVLDCHAEGYVLMASTGGVQHRYQVLQSYGSAA